MTATDKIRTRSTYDSGDPVAIYDATAEAKNYLTGKIMNTFPRPEALQRAIAVRRHFTAIDASALAAVREAREEYRRQINELNGC